MAMPLVEIEADVYVYLRSKVRDFNESVSGVLRRELKLPAANTATLPPTPTLPATPTLPPARVEAPSTEAATPFRQFMATQRGKYRRTFTYKWLAILGFIHGQDPKAFEKVLQIEGRSRKYFGRTFQEILNSGTSTHPKQIPGSDYWVMTNADNGQKRDMLRQALKVLGYSADDIRAADDAI